MILKLIQIIVKTNRIAIVPLKILIAFLDLTKLLKKTPIDVHVKTAKIFEIKKAKKINDIP